ncbi:hypothetical protein PASE110613_13710 [Paenibacillus sediminis]|uniref:Uncharacterized protein n=1 Tax=Paenibacillus sediminis TaxID=664909 RepID=A0ABS4H3W8_9BACL|nr:hypothetical protein [Paenibacillus sediminis]MBP1937232.1 hypothetical protein [Paenibacillus sediminis]
MTRYLFEYKIVSTGYVSEFSHVAESEEKAKEEIRARIADIEFVEESDVVVGKLIKTLDATNRYYECEGCSA